MAGSFYQSVDGLTLEKIVERTGAQILGEYSADIKIFDVAPIERARSDEITFIKSPKSLEILQKSDAGAVFCKPSMAEKVPSGMLALTVEDPQFAFVKVTALLYPEVTAPHSQFTGDGISQYAIVDETASIESGVTIEAAAVIGPKVSIGSGTVISANSVVGQNCQIGRNCYIGPNTTIEHSLIGNHVMIFSGAQLGQDGFGYLSSKDGHQKIPQIGRVIVQDHVEIGANSTIDRGALDDTVVGEGTKIDNLVQIGHNVKIGRHCILVAQVGIAGSATLGDFVVLGGDVGVNGHITIGDNVQIAAKSAVPSDVPSGARWGGIPARPMKAFLRDVAEINARAFGRGPYKKDKDENG